MKNITLKPCITIIFISCLIGCKPKNVQKHGGEKDLFSFKPVLGISYVEVARRLDNGLSFNEIGYQLEPEWQMKFVSNDSVSIFSPEKKRFINFPLTRGYDSIFNTARTWLKVKKLTRDSLLLQLLEARSDSIDTRGSRVFMTFYAENYVKNKLHKTAAALQVPSKNDTVFVRSLVELSEKDISKAFAARQPASVQSARNFIKVSPRHAKGDIFNNFDTSDDYMYPTYDIAIKDADTTFNYFFSVIVDTQGKLHYEKPLIPFTEEGFERRYIAQSKAVLEKYLSKNLNVIPGSTLGMKHASAISIHAKGQPRTYSYLTK